jgi:DNA-binding LacI/PurR family transcriptional regulator
MRVTLKDIADEAGVSMMTVSNVVNGKRARVSPDTIERIQRIVAARGYVPSASARSLAARASKLIGLLVPAADEDSLMISPHNVAIARAATTCCSAASPSPVRSARRSSRGAWTARSCSGSWTRTSRG